MAERRAGESQDAEAQMDEYVRSVAADQGPAAEVDKAVHLLERGAISQTEFETIKSQGSRLITDWKITMSMPDPPQL